MNKLFCALALALAACSPSASEPPPLAGARIGGPFALTDQYGQPKTDRSFAGKYRIMYFGYTFCPDVCPTDMANLSRGLAAFGIAAPKLADKIVLVFTSVDPARDTQPVLKDFTAAFGPRVVGLTGTPEAIAAMTKSYGVAYSIPPGQPKDGYIVEHSRVAYLMDPDNKPLALLPQDGTPQAISDELAKWVK